MARSARAQKLETLTTSQAGRVLTARFENPPLNFMNAAFARDLRTLVSAAEHDPTVGAVVLTGAPADRFITHFDVEELSAAARTPTPPLNPSLGSLIALAGLATTAVPGARRAWEKYGRGLGVSLATLSRLHSCIRAMHRSGVVYLAAINGPCLGGGLELALACDLRISGDDDSIRYGQPEILGGILPGAGGTQHLPRIVGTAQALELILEGRIIGAPEALEIGLVHQVVPQTALLPQAQAVAERLATRSPMAVRSAKRSVYAAGQLPLRLGLLVEAGGLIASGRTPESRRLGQVFARELHRLGDTPFLADPEPWQRGGR
jgi:enoyl-CoA hydratase